MCIGHVQILEYLQILRFTGSPGTNPLQKNEECTGDPNQYGQNKKRKKIRKHLKVRNKSFLFIDIIVEFIESLSKKIHEQIIQTNNTIFQNSG